MNKFSPRFINQKRNGEIGSGGHLILLLNTPHAHAHMLSFDNNCYT